MASRARVLARISMVARYAAIAPLVMGLPLVRRIPWRIIWVVNAGSESDRRSYGALARIGRLLGIDVGPIGLFRISGIGWGLIVATPSSNDELRSSAERSRRLVADVERFRGRRIALAGVIPSCFTQHRVWPDDDRFVRGQYATVHMIRRNVEDVLRRNPELADRAIAIVGVGATGQLVANDLAHSGYELLALDPRPEAASGLGDGVRFLGMDTAALADAGVVVLLSTGGDEGVASIASALIPGTAVVSDTHPKVSRSAARDLHDRGVIVYESALTRRGTRFVPKLPRWPADTIPGCVAQAIVECSLDRTVIEQDAFTILGDRLFESRLDRPGGLDGDERAGVDRSHT